MNKTPSKYELHIRLDSDLAHAIRDRAARANRSITAEIRRVLRAAYNLGPDNAGAR